MTYIFDNYNGSLRSDLKTALNLAHKRLGQTGDWLTSEQRVAVFSETRHAWNCDLCQALKSEISPYGIDGEHQALGNLPKAWINVIHRVTTDPARLSERWFKEALSGGMVEDEFIEVISVCVQTIAIDVFASGIGLPIPPLPSIETGKPQRKRHPEAKAGPGWASTISPDDAGSEFADFYANESHFYTRRSLTLVPQESRRLWELLNGLYLEDPRIFELEGLQRGISRAQMEFLAARASALLGCYY